MTNQSKLELVIVTGMLLLMSFATTVCFVALAQLQGTELIKSAITSNHSAQVQVLAQK